jgi:hypothetical protein
MSEIDTILSLARTNAAEALDQADAYESTLHAVYAYRDNFENSVNEYVENASRENWTEGYALFDDLTGIAALENF